MEISDILLSKLKSSKNIVAVCGAGISQESGVPTFRGKNGLWKKYRAEELANFDAFINNPELVWEWYNFRKRLILEIEPNAGHYALTEMENLFDNFFIITQNVDNLHRRAGNKNVIEIHGNIMKSKCIKCNKSYDNLPYDKNTKKIPECNCGEIIRPDVVWFGEMLPEDLVVRCYELIKDAHFLFVIGTSGYVYPVASFPMIAKEHGAYIVEINIERSDISEVMDEILLGPSGKILPEIIEKIKS